MPHGRLIAEADRSSGADWRPGVDDVSSTKGAAPDDVA